MILLYCVSFKLIFLISSNFVFFPNRKPLVNCQLWHTYCMFPVMIFYIGRCFLFRSLYNIWWSSCWRRSDIHSDYFHKRMSVFLKKKDLFLRSNKIVHPIRNNQVTSSIERVVVPPLSTLVTLLTNWIICRFLFFLPACAYATIAGTMLARTHFSIYYFDFFSIFLSSTYFHKNLCTDVVHTLFFMYKMVCSHMHWNKFDENFLS